MVTHIAASNNRFDGRVTRYKSHRKELQLPLSRTKA